MAGNSYKGASSGEGLSDRMACVMCGWWRTVSYGVSQKTGLPREVRFDKVDPSTATVWRRERLRGAGRGQHGASIEVVQSKTLRELDPDIKEQIRSQCKKILEILGS